LVEPRVHADHDLFKQLGLIGMVVGHLLQEAFPFLDFHVAIGGGDEEEHNRGCL
jgi:hypothetical protein